MQRSLFLSPAFLKEATPKSILLPWDILSLPVNAVLVMNPRMLYDSAHCPDPSENKEKGHDCNSAQDLLPFPESRRGWVPMQMLLLSSSSSGGRLRSSQAHLALTPLRFEPSVSIPLSTLSCLKRSKTPDFLGCGLNLCWNPPWLNPTFSSSCISPICRQFWLLGPVLWCIS